MRRNQINFFKFFIMGLILITVSSQAQYLVNPTFKDQNCAIAYPSKETCWSTKLSDSSWIGRRYSALQTEDNFGVINAKTVNETVPDEHAIRLTSKLEDSAEPMCALQRMAYLAHGVYLLNLFAYVEAENSKPQNQTIHIYIKNYRDYFYDKKFKFNSSKTQLQISEVIHINQTYQDVTFFICDASKSNYHSFVVRDVHLRRMDDNCNSSEASSQTMTDGTSQCVPHPDAFQAHNCEIFMKTQKNLYVCGACDQSSSTPHRLPSFSTGYYLCGQVLIPGAINYEATDVKKDPSGKFLVLAHDCEKGGSFWSHVAIPSEETPDANRLYSYGCRPDQEGVNIWNVNDGKYIPKKCYNNYGIGRLDIQSEDRICVSKDLKAYDSNCLKYKQVFGSYIFHSYNCSQCPSPYVKALFGQNFPYHNHCLLQSQLIPHCKIYYRNDENQKYYCKHCQVGYFQVRVGKNGVFLNTVCSKFPPFYWSKSLCQFYDIDSLNSTFMKCGKCNSQSSFAALCKNQVLNADACNSPDRSEYGIEVYVDGVQHCALGMMIENCAQYESIENKILSRCQICKTGYIPTRNGLKCGRRKANCAKLDNQNINMCIECINPQWPIVNGQCTCSFFNTFEDGRKQCYACHPGFILSTVLRITWDAVETQKHCLSRYQGTVNCKTFTESGNDDFYICKECKEGYEMVYMQSQLSTQEWFYGCMKPANRVSECSRYHYIPSSSKQRCIQCNDEGWSRTLTYVHVDGEIITRCPAISDHIPNCYLHRDGPDGVYYCQRCENGSVQVPVGPTEAETVCLNEKVYNEKRVPKCLYYKRDSLKSETIECLKCSEEALKGSNCQPA